MGLLTGFSKRGIENPALPLTSSALLSLLGPDINTDAGVAVTPETSLAMSAVWRATTLISSLGGSLPLQILNVTSHEPVANKLMQNPHPEMPALELWRLSYVHRCLWGNSYFFKERDAAKRIVNLLPIDPSQVRVGKAKKSVPGNPTRKVFEVTGDNGVEALTPNEIFHVPHFGYDGITGCSPVRAATAAIALALAAEKSASKLFGSGNLLSGILQTEQRLDQESAETLQERWRSKFAGAANAHEVAVLDSGAEFQPMTMPSADAQMLESRDFAVTEISRFFGVPPYLMFQTERTTSWGTGLEQQATGFIKFDLHPQWLAPLEWRITKELLTASDVEARYKLEGLLRGDTMARSEFYRVMREIGVYSANDIRDLEDMPRVEDGDMRLQPMNMLPLGTDMAQIQQDNAEADRALQQEQNQQSGQSA